MKVRLDQTYEPVGVMTVLVDELRADKTIYRCSVCGSLTDIDGMPAHGSWHERYNLREEER